MGCGCNKKNKKQDGALKETLAPKAINLQKNKMPGAVRQVWNFTKSVTNYVRSGMENIDDQGYQVRLKICDGCPFRENDRCTKCGCFIEVKARWAKEACPDHRWPEKIEKK
tara:strand:- start:4643 stop:4975 length:333 start_codon:yes stop_codon:yes gene_type:complete